MPRRNPSPTTRKANSSPRSSQRAETIRRNGLREMAVGAVDEPARREVPRQLEGGHLGAGVDPGVRAAGAEDPDGLLEQALQGLFDHLLDGDGVLLPLPAGVGGAAVGEGEAVGIHAFPRESRKNGPQIPRYTHGQSATPKN